MSGASHIRPQLRSKLVQPAPDAELHRVEVRYPGRGASEQEPIEQTAPRGEDKPGARLGEELNVGRSPGDIAPGYPSGVVERAQGRIGKVARSLDMMEPVAATVGEVDDVLTASTVAVDQAVPVEGDDRG
jgi:hypothetical protein